MPHKSKYGGRKTAKKEKGTMESCMERMMKKGMNKKEAHKACM